MDIVNIVHVTSVVQPYCYEATLFLFFFAYKKYSRSFIKYTLSLNCYRLVDATELWAPEWPETVSFPKQSISWTLYIKHGTHNIIIHYLLITHTYFHFKFAHIRPVLSILYIVFLLFCTLPTCILLFYYLCPVLLLSICYTVELLSL